MKIRVAACQQSLQEPVSQEAIDRLRAGGFDFVCLPEHYPLPGEIRSLEEAASRYTERKAYLVELSRQIGSVVIGGTLTERTDRGYYNTCYVFDRGTETGYYRKVHPTEREVSAGVLRGEEFKAFDVQGVRFGVLICADVLNLRSFDEIRALECMIAFVPTASPFRPGETPEEKFERDRAIFQEGARRMGCPVVKTCGVGTTFGHPLQGRSLIATSERVVARAEPQQEAESLILAADLEI